MLSGLDLEIVGVYLNDTGETLCLKCAAAKLGGLRTERIITRLERSRQHEPVLRWQAEERTTDNGYECGCERHTARGEFCERCAEELCSQCGTRLDSPAPTVAQTA